MKVTAQIIATALLAAGVQAQAAPPQSGADGIPTVTVFSGPKPTGGPRPAFWNPFAAFASAFGEEWEDDDGPAPGGLRPRPRGPAPTRTRLSPQQSADREASQAAASAASVASWAQVAASQVAARASAAAASVAASATSEASARQSAYAKAEAYSASRAAARSSAMAKESADAAAYSLSRASAAAARTAARQAARSSWSAAMAAKMTAAPKAPAPGAAAPPKVIVTVTAKGREEDGDYSIMSGEFPPSSEMREEVGLRATTTTTSTRGPASITEVVPVLMTSPVVAAVPGFVSAPAS